MRESSRNQPIKNIRGYAECMYPKATEAIRVWESRCQALLFLWDRVRPSSDSEEVNRERQSI